MSSASAQDRYAVGLQLFQAGNYHLAERTLREALAIEPTHHLSHAVLALSLQILGRPKEALAAADASLAIHPNVDALRARALAKNKLGDLTAAYTAASDAVKLAPSSSWAAHTLAWVLERLKRFRDAEDQYVRAADLAPENKALRAHYGRFLIRRRRLKEAEAVAALIASDVELDVVLLLRGELAVARGGLDEAREFALWVLSRDARNPEAIILLTLAMASRKPLLRFWMWHYRNIVLGPVWRRLLWGGALVTALIVAGMAVPGAMLLSIPLCVYLLIARSHVEDQVRAELRSVRLSQSF